MEVPTALRRYLLTGVTITGYVVDKVWKDELEEKIDGTGGMAVVVSQQSGWASPDPVNSWEYPRLFVDSIADPTRDGTGGISILDAADKARALNRACREMLLFPKLRGVRIGAVGSNPGLYVASCALWADARRVTPADQHPPTAGDTVTVRTEYALAILHE